MVTLLDFRLTSNYASTRIGALLRLVAKTSWRFSGLPLHKHCPQNPVTGVARSKWESQSTFFEDCSLPVSHKSSSPGVKQEWLHRIHTETGRKIKKHLWACYCNITQVRSVGEAAGAAEKLVTSISTFSMRIPVGAPGSGDIP